MAAAPAAGPDDARRTSDPGRKPHDGLVGVDEPGMRFPTRIRTAVGIVVISMAMTAFAAAGAQTAIEVPQGSSFTVENGTECAPNTDVKVYFSTPASELRQIGSAISDGTGNFSTEVALPDDVALGTGTVTVECDITDAVLLYDVEVVAATSSDLMSYAPYALGAIALIALVLVVLSRRGDKDDDPADGAAVAAGDAEPEPADADTAAVGDDDESDDGPEYWFWDANTERGPAKRLACLTETTFYLHEVPAHAFAGLLDRLAAGGPDETLSKAFFKVAVADIDEIRHRGTEMRVTFRGPNGFVSRTIDLATEVDGVIGLLSRQVPVMADPPVQSS